MAGMISPTRLALLLEPPTIVVEFTKGSDDGIARGNGPKPKRYIRRFKLRKVSDTCDAAKTVKRLQKMAPEYLGPKIVDTAQLTRLVGRLLSHKKGENGSKENSVQNGNASKGKATVDSEEREAPSEAGGEKKTNSFVADDDADASDKDSADRFEGVDLNKVSQFELAMAKKRMDENFFKNRLKPGDEGYVHDKQVVFDDDDMDSDNSWDDEEEEEE